MNKLKTGFSVVGGMGLPIVGSAHTLGSLGGRYIPYTGSGLGIPCYNTYPQILGAISQNSPTHGAALKMKRILTFGQGFDYTDISEASADSFDNINDSFESLNDVLENVCRDYTTFGGFALKVHWNYNKTIGEIEHVPFEEVRMGVPVDGKILDYIVSNDWDNNLPREFRREYIIKAFDPSKISDDAPIFVDGEVVGDDVTIENAFQLIYYKDKTVGQKGFYPVPDYVTCLDSAFAQAEIIISMKKGVDNGLNGAYIISMPDSDLSDEAKQIIVEEINQGLAGAENTGSIYLVPDNVELTKLEAIPADTLDSINPSIIQFIISSHLIPAILVEYSHGGGFNNRAKELETAIKQFQKTSIKAYQNKIVRVFNSVLSWWHTNEVFKLKIMPFKLDEDTEDVKEVETNDSSSIENKD